MAVIPGGGQRQRKTDDEYPNDPALGTLRPRESVAHQLRPVCDRQGRAQIGESPLEQLVLPNALPDTGIARGALGTHLLCSMFD